MLPPYTPTRNASAERIWGIVLRPVAKMIAHAGKDDKKLSLRPYGMHQAFRIHNELPTRGHSPPRAPSQLQNPDVVPDLSVYKVMFCDGYRSINDHEIPTKVSNSRIKCTNLGWDPERRCHIVYIPEIDRITQSLSAEWNQRSFTSFGPSSNSIVQARRELPRPARTEAQKTIDASRAEKTKATRQAQQQIAAVSKGLAPSPRREPGQPVLQTTPVAAYNPK